MRCSCARAREGLVRACRASDDEAAQFRAGARDRRKVPLWHEDEAELRELGR